jgi:serine O-acetyltransferase
MQKYHYQGPAIAEMIRSYASDQEPFLRDATVSFPPKKENMAEMGLLQEILFPSYWNCGRISQPANRAELEAKLDEFGELIRRSVETNLRLAILENLPEPSADAPAEATVDSLIAELPRIRETLKKDIVAAYDGDPAAMSYTEIIRCYPGFSAILIHRVAHFLYGRGCHYSARELSERIHSLTSIDIHPGAEIGDYFFIDHGAGVVIGETTIIGDWVRIYQGVTLGALHFVKDEQSKRLKKGYKRHPTIGNCVVIGAGTNILGTVNVGNHVNIGANSWITQNIPDETTVYIIEHPRLEVKKKSAGKGEAHDKSCR